MKRKTFFSRSGILSECFESKQGAALAVLGAVFFSTFGVGAFTFALSLRAGEAGISASWLGLAFSGYFLARLVLAPLAGYGADYLGAKPLLLAATAFGALAPGLYYFFPIYETFGLVQICLGFCAGIVKPVSMALLGECGSKSMRGRLFGAYNACLYSAFVAGPLAGGATIHFQGGIGELTLLWPSLGMLLSFLFFLQGRGGRLIARQKFKERAVKSHGVSRDSLRFFWPF